jgi:hypothetical protein
VHVHLENNVLFPKARALAGEAGGVSYSAATSAFF